MGVKPNSYSRYKAVKYCGKACQLGHWKDEGHKKTCPSLFVCGLGRRPARYLAHGEAIRHAKRLEPWALDDLNRYDPEMAEGRSGFCGTPGPGTWAWTSTSSLSWTRRP